MSRKSIILVAAGLLVASSGWLYAFLPVQAPAMFLQNFQRNACRILYWDQGPRGELTVAYSSPKWNDGLAAQYDAIKPGQRARLGKDQWASLDTNLPLTIGGTRLAAGYYYLTMERSQEGWNLVFHDAAGVRAKHVDAVNSSQLSGGTVIPLHYKKESKLQPDLSIRFLSPDKKNVQLEIYWGPYKLTAPVVPDLGSA